MFRDGSGNPKQRLVVILSGNEGKFVGIGLERDSGLQKIMLETTISAETGINSHTMIVST